MGFVIGSFVLLLIVAYLLARPLIVPAREQPESDESSLSSEKERLLADIRDLDADFATGKLSEEDHRRMRATTVARAADTLRAIEQARTAAAADEPAASADEPEDGRDPVERQIAARRRELDGLACPGCGAVHETDDRFCRHCGTDLTPATVR